MGSEIIDAEQRLVVAKTVLSIMRAFAVVYIKNERFGSCADDCFLSFAIFVGQVEGKPMSASKLAEFAGLPRPTVVRKLAGLKRRGIVEATDSGVFRLNPAVLNSDASVSEGRRIRRQFIRAAAELSKMDSLAIARR